MIYYLKIHFKTIGMYQTGRMHNLILARKFQAMDVTFLLHVLQDLGINTKLIKTFHFKTKLT